MVPHPAGWWTAAAYQIGRLPARDNSDCRALPGLLGTHTRRRSPAFRRVRRGDACGRGRAHPGERVT